MKVLVVVITALFFTTAAAAEEIIVPVDNYPPWKIVENSRFRGGIDAHLVAALLEGLDLTPKYQVYPWKRCLLMMKQGKGDLISGVTMNSERREYLSYLDPPYKTKSRKVLVVLKGNRENFKTFQDLYGKDIGYLRGAFYFPEFHEEDQIVAHQVNSDDQGLKLVLAGRLDGYLMTEENSRYHLMKDPEISIGLEVAEWRYNKDVNVYFAISRRSKLLDRKELLETRLQHLVESGESQKIIEGFFKK